MGNIAILCSGCHIIKWHSQGDPTILEKIKEKRGKRWWEKLLKKSRQRPESSYLNENYYLEVIKKLK